MMMKMMDCCSVSFCLSSFSSSSFSSSSSPLLLSIMKACVCSSRNRPSPGCCCRRRRQLQPQQQQQQQRHLHRRGAVGRGAAEQTACGGGSVDGLTGSDIVDLVGLCHGDPRGTTTARHFAGVLSSAQLADVKLRDVLPAAAERDLLQRPRGGRQTRTRPRCYHYADRETDADGRRLRRACRWRPPPHRTVLVINVGEHWVTVCLDRQWGVLYLDSYGNPPVLPSVRRFLRRCATGMGFERPADQSIFYNRRVVQSLESNYCGFFAVLWTLVLGMTATDASEPLRKAVAGARIRFFKQSKLLRRNDRLCAKFSERLAASLHQQQKKKKKKEEEEEEEKIIKKHQEGISKNEKK